MRCGQGLGLLTLTQVTPETLPAVWSEALVTFMTLAGPSLGGRAGPGKSGAELEQTVSASTLSSGIQHLEVHREAPDLGGQEVVMSSPVSLLAGWAVRAWELVTSKWWQGIYAPRPPGPGSMYLSVGGQRPLSHSPAVLLWKGAQGACHSFQAILGDSSCLASNLSQELCVNGAEFTDRA